MIMVMVIFFRTPNNINMALPLSQETFICMQNDIEVEGNCEIVEVELKHK